MRAWGVGVTWVWVWDGVTVWVWVCACARACVCIARGRACRRAGVQAYGRAYVRRYICRYVYVCLSLPVCMYDILCLPRPATWGSPGVGKPILKRRYRTLQLSTCVFALSVCDHISAATMMESRLQQSRKASADASAACHNLIHSHALGPCGHALAASHTYLAESLPDCPYS